MNNVMSASKNVLISGATGFLGLKVLPALCEYGYNVTAITRNANNCSLSFGYNNLVVDMASFQIMEF